MLLKYIICISMFSEQSRNVNFYQFFNDFYNFIMNLSVISTEKSKVIELIASYHFFCIATVQFYTDFTIMKFTITVPIIQFIKVYLRFMLIFLLTCHQPLFVLKLITARHGSSIAYIHSLFS